jgi:putative SOS response-associated peptidase YedK
MCGRITRTSPREAIANEFGVNTVRKSTGVLVKTIISINGEKRLGPTRWGFVSPTAKEPKLAPINARAETLSTSPMFRDENGLALAGQPRYSEGSEPVVGVPIAEVSGCWIY